MNKLFLGICQSMVLTTFGQIKLSQQGNTAIGASTDPVTSAKLQVIGNYATFTNSNAIPTSAAYIRARDTYSSATTPDYTWYNNDQTGFFHPGQNLIGVTVGGIEKIRIQNSITFFPDNAANAITSAPLIRNSNAYSTSTSPGFTWWGNDVTGFFHPTLNNIGISTAGAERMRIDANGNVGINAAPTLVYKLKVGGSVNATSFPVSSDARFKTNIKTVDRALDKIMKLNGVSYEFKESEFKSRGFAKGLNIGFLAQDVKKVLPELVKEDEEGYYAVIYDGMIPVLVEAIKEQQLQIENLQSQLKQNQEKVLTSKNNSGINPQSSTSSYMLQNKPNPFSEQTVITYKVAEGSTLAEIVIFNLQGALVKAYKNLDLKSTSISISGKELQAGMYLYSLIVDNKEVDTKKMILLD
jgi:hypothetical protein